MGIFLDNADLANSLIVEFSETFMKFRAAPFVPTIGGASFPRHRKVASLARSITIERKRKNRKRQTMMRWSVHEFNVLALLKGNDRYIFVYDDMSRDEVISTFRDQAADPNLSLTWFDAVVLTRKSKEQVSQVRDADGHTSTRY